MNEKNEILNILAYYPERLNMLLEMADESVGIKIFNVYKNIPVENSKFYRPVQEYRVSFFNWYETLDTLDRNGYYALGVIGPQSKEMVFDTFRSKVEMELAQFKNIIHPTSYISRSTKLNYGLQMEPLSSISVNTSIGFGVNIKRNCNIGHHCIIGDFVTINPGVTISGFVTIGHNTLIGAGSVIKDGLAIGNNTIIGSGSNVVKDIPNDCVAYGNPCKVYKINDSKS